MLTARAEYRLRLRADNAASRLTPMALAMGCVGEERQHQFAEYRAAKDRLHEALERVASSEELARAGLPVKRDGSRQSLFDWLRFPDISIDALGALGGDLADLLADFPADIRDELAEDAHYAPYLERQAGELRDLHSHQAMRIAPDLDYRAIAGLSNEMVERLSAAQPDSMAAAARVRGITPAALTAILMHAKRRSAATKAA
jgi:tRNA uridine 5-carboxymethylaminomethyl modification enzyme